MLLALALACTGGTPGDSAAGDPAAGAEPCDGLPNVYFAWYPREGMDVLEVLIDRPGTYELALASDEWSGESGLRGAPTHPVAGDTLALQTVLQPGQVEPGRRTWFTEARFQRWALRDRAADDAGIGGGCVGVGFPGCCTRDRPR